MLIWRKQAYLENLQGMKLAELAGLLKDDIRIQISLDKFKICWILSFSPVFLQMKYDT